MKRVSFVPKMLTIYARDERRNVWASCLRYWGSFCTKTGMVAQLLVKVLNTEFHENTFSGFRIFVCGRTDRQANTTNPVAHFCSFCFEDAKATVAGG
jgi:hypothetical protein